MPSLRSPLLSVPKSEITRPVSGQTNVGVVPLASAGCTVAIGAVVDVGAGKLLAVYQAGLARGAGVYSDAVCSGALGVVRRDGAVVLSRVLRALSRTGPQSR